MTDAPLPDHVQRNRTAWDEWAPDYVSNGEVSWRLGLGDEKWGVWDIPERDAQLFPADVTGLDAIELGCGTAYVSAWLARRGARPVGIDNSEQQLATARRLQQEHGLEFPLLHGSAEAVPYPDASFDLAISEYGASIWAEPAAWIGETARLLRPGGQLIFLVNSTVLMLCMPDEERAATAEMLRPQRGLGRLEWSSDASVNFALSHGDWIALLRRHGFTIERLAELYPPAGTPATTSFIYATPEWAQQWPTEEVWIARKAG